jgi:hypothetical protein
MPRREGDVFLLGTAISVSSWGVVGGIVRDGRLKRFGASRNADKAALIKAALIEDGVVQS